MVLARGVDERAYLHEQAARAEAGRLRKAYECHEFNLQILLAGLSLVDPLLVNHATSCSCGLGAFLNVTLAQRVAISNLGAASIRVAFNAATNHKVTVGDGETLDWNFVEVGSLYLWSAPGSVIVPLRIVLC
jgi:hypothetical protein